MPIQLLAVHRGDYYILQSWRCDVIRHTLQVICDLTGAKPTVDGHFRDLRCNVERQCWIDF